MRTILQLWRGLFPQPVSGTILWSVSIWERKFSSGPWKMIPHMNYCYAVLTFNIFSSSIPITAGYLTTNKQPSLQSSYLHEPSSIGIANTQYLCYPESQNGRGWKGTLEVIWPNFPAQPGSSRASCSGQYSDAFWVSPNMETLQPLGNFLQFSGTLMAKKCFLMFRWSLIGFSLCLNRISNT